MVPPNPGVCSICHQVPAMDGHNRRSHVTTHAFYAVFVALPVAVMVTLLAAAVFREAA